ncbi:Mas-related G-protein coupled receptor member H, partial [Acanthisitta chloris]
LLTVISVERCISVLFPVWYRCRRPKHLSGVVSAMLWALTGGFVFLMYFSFTNSKDSEVVFAGLALAISVVLSLMMLISNLFLFIKLCCSSRRRHPGKLFVAVLQVYLNLPSTKLLFPENAPLLLALLNCSLNPMIYVLVGSCRRRRFQRSVKVALRRVFEEK